MTDRPPRGHRLAGALVLILLASTATAHLMRAGHGTLNVVGEKAYVVLSLPVAAFAHTDAAAAVDDGILTSAELQANKASLREAIRREIAVTAGGVRAEMPTIMLSLPTGVGHAPDRGSDVIVMIVAQLGGVPASIAFESNLWASDDAGLKIRATVSEGRETLRDEIGEVSAHAPAYTFFATPGETVTGFLRRGLLHFVGGPDHLVFALMVLVVAQRRRRAVGWLMAFVAGCGLGLTASAAGWLHPSVAWTEAVIALSVVAFAAIALAGRTLPAVPGAALVLGCAVAHGFGFASISRFGSYLPAYKVAGFTIGVALGVAVFAALCLAIAALLRRAPDRTPTVLRALAAAALAIGLWWAVDRSVTAWSEPPPVDPGSGHGPPPGAHPL